MPLLRDCQDRHPRPCAGVARHAEIGPGMGGGQARSACGRQCRGPGDAALAGLPGPLPCWCGRASPERQAMCLGRKCPEPIVAIAGLPPYSALMLAMCDMWGNSSACRRSSVSDMPALWFLATRNATMSGNCAILHGAESTNMGRGMATCSACLAGSMKRSRGEPWCGQQAGWSDRHVYQA